MWGWGNNADGELGDGTSGNVRTSPVQIGTDSDWADVAAGLTHSIALKSDGSMWGWGDNTYGELGDGTTTSHLSPTRIGAATNWLTVVAGDTYSIALLQGGPATTPAAPTGVRLTSNGTTSSVTFNEPFNNGGDDIIGYSALCVSSNGGITRGGSNLSSPIAVPSLTAGKTYTCVVSATNTVGTGPSSTPSPAVIVPTLPGAPTDVRAAPSVANPSTGGLTVVFSSPANDGGSAITQFTASCTSGDGGASVSTSATSTALSVTGLTTAKSYTCTVRATNVVGSGPASTPSTPIVVGVPRAPTAINIAPGPANSRTGAIKVSYAAGANNGAALTRYTASCSSTNGGVTRSAAHVGGAVAPISVRGLTTKKTYKCIVTATNARGTGPASIPSSAVIAGVPAAPAKPTIAKRAAGSVRVTFSRPANNGAPITRFVATCTSSNGGATRSNIGTKSPIVVNGLARGKTYGCTVRATNSRGTGAVSPRSATKII